MCAVSSNGGGRFAAAGGRAFAASLGAVTLVLLSACGGGTEAAADHGGLSLAVLPLEIADIDVACYDVTVVGSEGVVVTRGDPAVAASDGDDETLCSDRFGVGPSGDILYVAPCDASAGADVDPDASGIQNEVTVWVDGLYLIEDAARVPIADAWVNPCDGQGCSATFDCVENADTEVVFDITIMRQSASGFFDILLEFEDLFCAAKVDCRQLNETQETTDDPLLRLITGADGTKLPTVVFAIACSAGPGDENRTHLYMSDIAIDCDDQNLTIPVDEPNVVFDTDPAGIVEQAYVFQGEDNLSAEDRLYWNVAIGLAPVDDSDPLAPIFDSLNCVLSASATVSAGPLDEALDTAGAFVTYPYIHAAVPLTDDNGTLVCTQHPVNAGDEVVTEYSELGSLPPEIIWEMSMVGDGNVTVSPFPDVP